MILVLEGPDGAGKTTLFEQLKPLLPKAVFVPTFRTTNADMAEVERLADFMWRHLSDPKKLYVCDRHHAVSSLVYGPLYGRQLVDYSRWHSEMFVVFLDEPNAVLEERSKRDSVFDWTRSAQVAAAYRELHDTFPRSMVYDPLRGVEHVVQTVLSSSRFVYQGSSR